MKRLAFVLAVLLLVSLLGGCNLQKAAHQASRELSRLDEKYLWITSETKDETKPGQRSATDYVVTQLNESGWSDQVGVYNFRLPKLTVQSEEASRINTTITSDFLDEAQDSLECYRDGKGNPYYSQMNFQVYLNGSVLSLLIESTERVSGLTEYRVYNLDVETGELPTKDNLMRMTGWSDDRLNSKVDDAIQQETLSVLREYYGPDATDEHISGTYEYARTMDTVNLSKAKPYFTDDQVMWLLMDMYMPGAGMRQHLVEVR